MIKFNFQPTQTFFETNILVTWQNTCLSDKSNKGVFTANTMHEAITRLKGIIKAQIAITVTSIANERENAFRYSWTPTTTKDEHIKFEYLKLCEKLKAFSGDCYRNSFDNVVNQLVTLCNTTLQTLTPSTTSKRHNSIHTKVTALHTFATTINSQFDALSRTKELIF